MEPWGITVRALATFIFLMALLRVSGKRTIYQSSAFDFVLALVLGDLVDNVLFDKSPFAQFAVAAIVLVGSRFLVTLHKGRAN